MEPKIGERVDFLKRGGPEGEPRPVHTPAEPVRVNRMKVKCTCVEICDDPVGYRCLFEAVDVPVSVATQHVVGELCLFTLRSDIYIVGKCYWVDLLNAQTS